MTGVDKSVSMKRHSGVAESVLSLSHPNTQNPINATMMDSSIKWQSGVAESALFMSNPRLQTPPNATMMDGYGSLAASRSGTKAQSSQPSINFLSMPTDTAADDCPTMMDGPPDGTDLAGSTSAARTVLWNQL